MTLGDLAEARAAGLFRSVRIEADDGGMHLSLHDAPWARLGELADWLVSHGATWTRGRLVHASLTLGWTMEARLGPVRVLVWTRPPSGLIPAPALPPPVEV